MKKLLVFLFVGLLLTGCGDEENSKVNSEDGNEIIDEAKESSRIRSVEAYADSIEVATTTYIILNEISGDVKICTGNGPATADCIIDATVAGNESGSTLAKKIATYYGEPVICESATYNMETSEVTVKNCTVGDDTKNIYSGNTTEGIKKVK